MSFMKNKVVAGIAVLAIAGTLIALPAMGSDSEHQDITLEVLEAKILSDNAAVKRAELAYDLAEEEKEEAYDNKGDSDDDEVEEDMMRKYYPDEADMNLYVAGKDLEDTQQSEVLTGVQNYYDYLLLVREIEIKNTEILRLQDELAAVEKKSVV